MTYSDLINAVFHFIFQEHSYIQASISVHRCHYCEKTNSIVVNYFLFKKGDFFFLEFNKEYFKKKVISKKLRIENDLVTINSLQFMI